ncbi:hypothetical protein FGIG_02261 [Fasciola gigantica]|uniref:ISXO2-like transposase domain-containing protein n=1 Tax=Fasciola gigantica TaxID=46835 RepID=A0A504YID3_FASGI|nr:hypothetical protein FGIG_02261 [Fasciola gigantica]
MRKPPPMENVAKSMPKPSQSSPSTSRKRQSNGNAKSQNTDELAHSSLDLRYVFFYKLFNKSILRSGSQPTNDAIGTTPSKKPLRIAVSPSYVELIKQSLPPDHVLVDENFNVIELEPQQSTKEQKTLSKLYGRKCEKTNQREHKIGILSTLNLYSFRLTTGLVEILPLGDVNSRTLEGGNRVKADAICENVFHNRDNWLNEPSLRLMDFFHMWKDEVKLLCWLARRRLIPNQVKCSRFNCSQQLHLVPDRNNIDGWVWRCDRCCQTRSIRHRTIFKHCDLSLKTATQILYLWCIGHPTELIPFDTDTSPEEAREWLYCIREVCRETNKELKERLGGIEEEDAEPGYCRVVEIDEALFTCRLKDRNGKDCVRKVWLLGGAERGTDRVFLVRCPQNSRDAFSLIPVVREFIKPGTAIITDDWEGYAPLNDLPEGYQHYVAQRSRGILNPGQEAVHIQKITCLWSHWKRSFESLNGTSVDDFDACLDEYLWRMQHSKAVLQSFCYSVTLLFDI